VALAQGLSTATPIDGADRSLETPRETTLATRVRRQSAINMVGGLLSQGVKFLLVIYVVRCFPPVQFGWLSFAIAVNAFLFVVGHFGLPTYGARTVARAGTIRSDVLVSICAARALLSLLGTAVAFAILGFVPTVGHEELLLVVVFGLSNVPVAGLVDWAFQGIHRQDVSAIINVVWQLLWLGLVIVGVHARASILIVPVALCVSALITAVLAYTWLIRKHGVERGTESVNLFRQTRRMLISGTALGTGTLLITVLVWSDIIVVRLLRGNEDAGLYAAGNRAALALAMLASYFVQGALPLLSRAAGNDIQFNACFQHCYDDLAFAFVPLSMWAIFYSREIIAVLFRRSEYAPATVVFQIFQLVLLATIFGNLYGIGALVASHRDADYQRSLVLTALFFVPFCIGLVHYAGITGGAAAALAAQVFCGFSFLRRSRGVVVANHRKALLMPALLGVLIVAVSQGFRLTVYGSLAVVMLAYGAAVVLRLRSGNYHHLGAC